MTDTIFQITEKVLTESGKYSSADGKLLRNLVLENAEKMDKDLLSVLIKNEETRKAYFTEVDGIQVFDKVKFSWIIQNKEFLPDSYTRYKNKIGLTNSRGEFISTGNDVELVFPYKDCILEGGQTKEDQKNNEIFYNETLAPDQVSNLLAPKAFCNAKKYDKDGVHEVTEITDEDNLIIRGNNLLALSSLLEKYRGKVKCCYIDPPYNTGSDSFGYNDRFNHSTWLTFMKNRLELARKLLRDDGCVYIQCDDNEQAYLKVLMDSVFGVENFVNTLAVKMSPSSGVKRRFSEIKFIKNKEFILLYKKKSLMLEPINDIINDFDINYTIYFDGTVFIPLSEKLSELNESFSSVPIEAYFYISEIKSFIQKNKNKIFRRHGPSSWAINNIENGEKIFERENKQKSRNFVYKVSNPDNEKEFELIFDIKNGNYERLEPITWKMDTNNELTLLRGDFWNCGYEGDIGNVNKEGDVDFGQGKKPERLIQDILKVATKDGDLVLDYHLGSGTTAAVAHKMGRRYIGIEQLDYGENDSVVRLQNVINGDQTGISKSQNWQGGGSFIYCELAKLNQNFVDKIQACKNDKEIKSVTEEILKSDFVSSKVKPSDINTSVKDYSELTFEEKQQLAMALLDKNQLYVNFSERKDPDMKLSKNDIKFSESFYGAKK